MVCNEKIFINLHHFSLIKAREQSRFVFCYGEVKALNSELPF